MFGFLKKKLKDLFGKAKEKAEEVAEAEEVGKKPEIKEKTAKQEKRLIKSEQEREKERKISKEIIQDIEKEGLEIKTPEEKFEEIAEEKEEKQSWLSKITKKFTTVKFSPSDFDELWQDFELSLLESNVALEVVEKIKERLNEDLVGIEIKKNDVEKTFKETLKEIISEILVEPFGIIEKINKKLDKPYIILFFGINGSGKTTSIAKMCYLLQKKKINCVLAAADTFRAASIEQLEKHGKKLNVKVIKHDYGADPTAVAFDAVKYAKMKKIDCVLIDTAGRMHTKENLMREMEKMSRVIKPDLKVFVAESITGNDATNQAKIFNEEAGIDGIILSKADVDEKGGTVLSIGEVTKKPILYLGVGQNYEDLEAFDKKKFLGSLGL